MLTLDAIARSERDEHIRVTFYQPRRQHHRKLTRLIYGRFWLRRLGFAGHRANPNPKPNDDREHKHVDCPVTDLVRLVAVASR